MSPARAVPVAAAWLALGVAVHAAEPPDAAPPPDSDTATHDKTEGSVTENLQGKDGVRIQTLCTHCNSANIQVGGLSEELVPLFRDGFPVIGGLATSMLLIDLPAGSVVETKVVKGPGRASLAEGAAGGEIALTGANAADMPLLQLFGQVGSYDLARTGIGISGTLSPRASGWLSLGHVQADLVDDDHDGWVDVPAVERSLAEGNLVIEPATGQRVLLGVSWVDEENPEGRGAYDPFRALTTGEDSWTREDQAFDRREFRVGWERDDHAGGVLALRALIADRSQSVRSQLTAVDGFTPNGTELIERLRIGEDDLWGSVRYDRPLGLRWRVAGGLTLSGQDVDAANREPLNQPGQETEPELAFESVQLVSGWVDGGYTPSSRWDVTFGVRHDVADLTTQLENVGAEAISERVDRSFAETSPRLTVRYFPARGWTLRGVVGRTFRPPRPILAKVCCGQRYQTTENVLPETAVTAGLEAVWAPSPRLRVAAWVARTEFDDHIVRVVGHSQFFIQAYALANVPEARADRAEVAVRWRALPRLQFEGSAGWLSFHNTGEREIDVLVAPPSSGSVQAVPLAIDRIPYRPVRTGTLAASWNAAENVTFFAATSYTGTMPIQQFTRLPQNSTLDTETLRATSAFWLVNVSAEVRVNRHLFVSAALNNVTDRLQNDLGDPTTDFNWGPLSGRSWTVGLKAIVDRPAPGGRPQ